MSKDQKKAVATAVNILKAASEGIGKALALEDFQPLRESIQNDMDRLVGRLSLQHGLDYEPQLVGTTKTTEPQPLKKMFGEAISTTPNPKAEKDILGEKPAQASPVGQTAEEVERQELKQKATDLYGKFVDIQAEALIDQFEDLVIRGVAKLAGLQVTEDNPKKIDAKYIATIKDAILKKRELDAAEGGKGTEGADKSGTDKK